LGPVAQAGTLKKLSRLGAPRELDCNRASHPPDENFVHNQGRSFHHIDGGWGDDGLQRSELPSGRQFGSRIE